MKTANLVVVALLWCTTARAQLAAIDTDALRLVHYGVATTDVARHAVRSFENSLAYHKRFFDYAPSRRTSVFLNDWSDYGNAGADVLPRNFVNVSIAPLHYAFETSPANERINAAMHHELVHIVVNDKAAGRDRFFRTMFGGKVAVSPEDPVSIVYSYLTAPRRYAPRWYQEGIAVFMETWMSGGLGRSLGGYDEMVFRAKILDSSRLYDPVGLESEGKEVDFQVGVNAYLYGTRFMSYLALSYGPESVVDWVSRTDGSRAHFTAAFRETFGLSLSRAWANWIDFEKEYQNANLARIRENPVTTFRPLSGRALGSVSKTHFDAKSGRIYAAVNYPGDVAHVVAIDLRDGSRDKLVDVRGPNLYSVSSLAFDADKRLLYFTTDNGRWRDLRRVNVDTRESETLIKDARVGDLAFNKQDGSLWGIRHYLGISSIVRVPPPYTEWNRIHSFPFGTDMYDVAISPDGMHLTGAVATISGRQRLVRMPTDSLLAGVHEPDVIFDFGDSNPESFSFSADGRHMFGSSYYSGVSNIYRYDIRAERMEILSNAETGFFRPVAVSSDSLVVLHYSSDGFRPVMIANRVADRVGAIRFLGQEVVERHPVVREWVAGSPGDVSFDSVVTFAGSYRGISRVKPASVYPIVQGYKSFVAVGLRADLSDDVGFHRFSATASVIPSTVVEPVERVHARVVYQYLGLTIEASHNPADFYDLFGPTRTGRKGSALEVSYTGSVVHDPPRVLTYDLAASGHTGLERLPDFQNVGATFSELVSARASIRYEDLRATIGSVQKERGVSTGFVASANYVNQSVYPRALATFDAGAALPLDHSSIWLRTAAGASAGSRDNPFANFFFGSFGNNWIDHQDEKRYRSYSSFPGQEINAISGTTFGKALVEWALPPLRFRRAGGSSLFLKWAQVTVFAAGVATNFDEPSLAARYTSAGSQLDLRIMLFSYLQTTLSIGYALSGEDVDFDGREFMVSLKIL